MGIRVTGSAGFIGTHLMKELMFLQCETKTKGISVKEYLK